MSNINLKFKLCDTTNLSELPIEDGSIIFAPNERKLWIDIDDVRKGVLSAGDRTFFLTGTLKGNAWTGSNGEYTQKITAVAIGNEVVTELYGNSVKSNSDGTYDLILFMRSTDSLVMVSPKATAAGETVDHKAEFANFNISAIDQQIENINNTDVASITFRAGYVLNGKETKHPTNDVKVNLYVMNDASMDTEGYDSLYLQKQY